MWIYFLILFLLIVLFLANKDTLISLFHLESKKFKKNEAQTAYESLKKKAKISIKQKYPRTSFTNDISGAFKTTFPKEIADATLGLFSQWESGAIDALNYIPELIHNDKIIREAAFERIEKALDLSANLLSDDLASLYRELLDTAKHHAQKISELHEIVPKISKLRYMIDHPYS